MYSEENWEIRTRQTARIVGTSDPSRLSAVVARARQSERRRARRAVADGRPGWISIGPRNVPGRIGALALDRERPGILYAGSAAGGVFETIDGGASWTPLWLDQQDSLAIGGLAVGGGAIYAATGEWVGGTGSTKYLYRSTDGGRAWRAVVDDTISDVVVDPVRPGRLFIGILSARDLTAVPRRAGEAGRRAPLLARESPSGFRSEQHAPRGPNWCACGRLPCRRKRVGQRSGSDEQRESRSACNST